MTSFSSTPHSPTPDSSTSGRNVSAAALLAFPLLLVLVFLLHFRAASDFFHFHLHYIPRDPARVVTNLVHAQNHWPMVHDPHLIGYLALPILPLAAYALYALGRRKRPLLSGFGLFLTVTGTIYLGGIFGMWTAFYRGLGNVDPQYLDGAIATFRGMTQPGGPFLLTTTLGKLAMFGLAVQALALAGVRGVPNWAIGCVAAGCLLFVTFWDLDNWMTIGSLLILAGFVPLFQLLRGMREQV